MLELLIGNGTSPCFVRQLAKPAKLIDLLDIIAGGDGFGNHRERGIDPLTGKEDPIYVSDRHFGDNIYKSVAWHKYIDGVFIADGHAGPVQVYSAGHAFALPETFGRTIGSIWSRAAEISEGKLRLGKEKTGLYIYSMGQAEHFMPKGRGALCSVANAGITFDLQRIREDNPSVYPSRYTATLGIVDARPYA